MLPRCLPRGAGGRLSQSGSSQCSPGAHCSGQDPSPPSQAKAVREAESNQPTGLLFVALPPCPWRGLRARGPTWWRHHRRLFARVARFAARWRACGQGRGWWRCATTRRRRASRRCRRPGARARSWRTTSQWRRTTGSRCSKRSRSTRRARAPVRRTAASASASTPTGASSHSPCRSHSPRFRTARCCSGCDRCPWWRWRRPVGRAPAGTRASSSAAPLSSRPLFPCAFACSRRPAPPLRASVPFRRRRRGSADHPRQRPEQRPPRPTPWAGRSWTRARTPRTACCGRRWARPAWGATPLTAQWSRVWQRAPLARWPTRGPWTSSPPPAASSTRLYAALLPAPLNTHV